MWQVLYHNQVVKRLKKLQPQVLEKLDFWVEIATQEGPSGLMAFTGINDEALTGVWEGFRSSRLNRQFRIIYSCDKDVLQILVIDITAHDYKRSLN